MTEQFHLAETGLHWCNVATIHLLFDLSPYPWFLWQDFILIFLQPLLKPCRSLECPHILGLLLPRTWVISSDLSWWLLPTSRHLSQVFLLSFSPACSINKSIWISHGWLQSWLFVFKANKPKAELILQALYTTASQFQGTAPPDWTHQVYKETGLNSQPNFQPPFPNLCCTFQVDSTSSASLGATPSSLSYYFYFESGSFLPTRMSQPLSRHRSSWSPSPNFRSQTSPTIVFLK